MRIDPRLLIEFAAVVENLSFTAAAKRLGVAQPWLSSRVRKLEDRIGFPLLTRTTRSVALTERGLQFYPAALAVARAAAAAETHAKELGRSAAHKLIVGIAPYTKDMRERRLLIERFTTTHPNIALELDVGWSPGLLTRLDNGDIDLTFLLGPFDGSMFDSLVLRQFGLAITMGHRHPLASSTLITPQQLNGRSIHVFTRSLNSALWDHMYSPIARAGALLQEMPDMAEGPPQHIKDDTTLAAYLDFGSDISPTPEVVRVPVLSSSNAPLSLLRRKGGTSLPAQTFWDEASGLVCEAAMIAEVLAKRD